jgi:hypothetical protein
MLSRTALWEILPKSEPVTRNSTVVDRELIFICVILGTSRTFAVSNRSPKTKELSAFKVPKQDARKYCPNVYPVARLPVGLARLISCDWTKPDRPVLNSRVR